MSVVIVVENMSDASTYVGECFLYQDVHSDTPDPDSGFHKLAGLCRDTGLGHDNHRHEELV